MKKKDLEATKRSIISHSIIKVGRLVNEMGVERARQIYELPTLTQAHLNLFPFIDLEGTTVSEIASRKQVSKQAISKMVKEMVEMNILWLKENPMDARSKLVCFHLEGPHSITKGLGVLAGIDKMIVKEFGEKKANSFLKNLLRVQDLLEGKQK